MVDYYALPSNWPGRALAPERPLEERGRCVQDALNDDFAGRSAHADRFEPFVLMHEFEALLFSDCVRFAAGIGMPDKAAAFQAIRDQFPCPESINDSPDTAPSKRVTAIVKGYQKPLHGTVAAIEIGLDSIKHACPHFNAWLGRLEAKASG